MKQVSGLLIVGLLAAVVAAQVPGGNDHVPPLGPPIPPSRDFPLPSPPSGRDGILARWTGRWNVEFANGVHQVHELREDMTATAQNPAVNWSSHGTIEFQGNSVTITYVDDRVERWTPVGDRMVVEHWFPAPRIPVKPPVLGIGDRAE